MGELHDPMGLFPSPDTTTKQYYAQLECTSVQTVHTSETAVDHMLMLSVKGATSFTLNSRHAKTKIPAILMSTRRRDIRASCKYLTKNMHVEKCTTDTSLTQNQYIHSPTIFQLHIEQAYLFRFILERGIAVHPPYVLHQSEAGI